MIINIANEINWMLQWPMIDKRWRSCDVGRVTTAMAVAWPRRRRSRDRGDDGRAQGRRRRRRFPTWRPTRALRTTRRATPSWRTSPRTRCRFTRSRSCRAAPASVTYVTPSPRPPVTRGGTIHRCFDILRYFSRDTYRDIIFYNLNFFFFFFPQWFSFSQKRYIIISTCDLCKVIPQMQSFCKNILWISVETN